MKETCSCGAKVSVPIVKIGESAGWDRAVEQIKDWRENHKHEFPPEPEVAPDMPTIVESVSHHEHALPFGFTREMEGDLA